MATQQHEVTFRERSRPPLWVVALAVVGFGALTVVLPLGYESTGHQVATALLPVLVVLAFTVLVHVEVRDGAVRWARRAGGVHLPLDRLVAVRVLHGAALREVRSRLTPSFRIHCPVWERVGVQLVALDDDGARIEHVVAVRDLDGFLTALGVSPPEQVSQPPVPV